MSSFLDFPRSGNQLYHGNTGPISILSPVLFHVKSVITNSTGLVVFERKHLISPSLTRPGWPTSVPGSGLGIHSSSGNVALAVAVNVILLVVISICSASWPTQLLGVARDVRMLRIQFVAEPLHLEVDLVGDIVVPELTRQQASW